MCAGRKHFLKIALFEAGWELNVGACVCVSVFVFCQANCDLNLFLVRLGSVVEMMRVVFIVSAFTGERE